MAYDAAPALHDGRYRLVEVLGRGGMATVYRAWDARLAVWRAVKVLAPQLAAAPNVERRFENEARTMARLRHRNIVSVHDVDRDGDRVYMVMELVDGGSLVDWVKRHGPMPPRMAVRVAREVLQALQVAHDARVVHRDIKPHNVLIDGDGTPKVTDFGIARLVGDDLGLTRTGAVMGTLSYMAPEQRESAKEADARADLYGVSATLYSLVTGQKPFDLYVPELKQELFAEVPAPLAEVIQRGTRYRPEDRWSSADEMRAALDGIEDALPEDGPTAPPLVDKGALGGTSAPPPEGTSPSLVPSEPTWQGEAIAVGEATGATMRAWGPETVTPDAETTADEPDAGVIEADGTLAEDGTLADDPGDLARARSWRLALIGGGLAVALAAGWRLVSADPDPAVTPSPEATMAAPSEVPEAPAPRSVAAPVEPGATEAGEGSGRAGETPAPRGGPGTGPEEPEEPGSVGQASRLPATAPEEPGSVGQASRLPGAGPDAPEDGPVGQASRLPATGPEEPEDVGQASRLPGAGPDEPVPARLKVNAVPWGELSVDGARLGRTPWSGELPSGSHTLRIETSSGEIATVEVELAPGDNPVVCWDFAVEGPCPR